MPSLEKSTQALPEGYVPVNPPAPMPPAERNLEPGPPTNMRCPVPPTSFTPDTSRQFYRGSTVPQFRVFSPQPLSGNNNTSAPSSTTVVFNSPSSSSSSTSTSTTKEVNLTAQSASIVTPVLNQGDNYFAIATLAPSYILLSASVSQAARVRVYATSAAQISDATRDSNTAPPFEVMQGLIADITIDSPPFTWLLTPIPTGSNGDLPPGSAAYVTITNVQAMSVAINVGLQYIPLT
jgi:hypothetical protein